MALQHRGIILQLVYVDDAPLGKPCRHTKAHRILRCRSDESDVGGAISGGIGVASWEGLLLEEYAGARITEANLVYECIAEGTRPIQADLLAKSGNILIVAHINPVAEVDAAIKSLLVDVAGKEVIFITQLEVDPSRGLIVIKRGG